MKKQYNLSKPSLLTGTWYLSYQNKIDYLATINYAIIKFSMIVFLLMLLPLWGIFTSTAHARSVIQTSGDVSQLIIPAAAYASTYLFEDDEGKIDFYKSFMLNLGITYGLKVSIDKKRPDGGSQSFPSGHTSVAFQGATFMNQRYGWKYGIPAYIGATFVGWSRVHSDKHDTSDVLCGAAIGIFSSYLFTKPFKGVAVAPVADEDSVGINFSIEW